MPIILGMLICLYASVLVAQDYDFDQGIAQVRQQLLMHKEQLEREYRDFPDNMEVAASLAQMCQTLGHAGQAAELYARCVLATNRSQTQWVALYNLGLMAEQSGEHGWDVACQYYLKAIDAEPNRAEPYVRVAQHYASVGNMKLACFYARLAARLPLPDENAPCAEKEMYELTRFDLLGQYAWYAQEYELGEWAVREAIHARPDLEYLQKNLMYYVDRRAQTEVRYINKAIPSGFGIAFSDSMKHGFRYDAAFLEQDSFALRVQELYEQHVQLDLDYAAQNRIPKIIHQIWLGSPLPERYKGLQATWLRHHPEWEYWLWTDADVEQLQLQNKKAYDAALTWGEKADIARYEILHRYGGLYIDTDFECVQPFDVLHHCCDFYAGIEHGECLVGNALIGARAGHPVLKRCIEWLQSASPGKAGWEFVADRTGPGHLTRCIKECLRVEAQYLGRCVLFPTGYFFPWYPLFGQVRTVAQAVQSIKPETFAIHHWHSSWVK